MIQKSKLGETNAGQVSIDLANINQSSVGCVEILATPDGPFTVITRSVASMPVAPKFFYAAAELPSEVVLASGWTANWRELARRIHPQLLPVSFEVVAVGCPTQSKAAAAAQRYYAGELSAIDQVAVWQAGTDFQQSGWQTLRSITPGAPLSYQEFAAALGRPKAVRAAASICARNAAALFIPCHRVLRADRSIGGFGWGIDVKQSLLAREQRGF